MLGVIVDDVAAFLDMFAEKSAASQYKRSHLPSDLMGVAPDDRG